MCVVSGVSQAAVSPDVVFHPSAVGHGVTVPAEIAAQLFPALPRVIVAYQVVLNPVIILLVFRKFPYSNLFDSLLTSVLASTFPCNLFFPRTFLSLFSLPIPTPNH